MRTQPYYTLGDIARKTGATLWQVRRLYERGLLPPAERIGLYRVVPAENLPAILSALISAGYVKAESEASHV